MKSRTIIPMLLFLFLGNLTVHAQNEKFKALFLYNFIKNIEWPQTSNKEALVIGVLGNSPISKELEAITASQRISGQPMKVKVCSGIEEMSDCHLVYVSPNKAGVISQLNAKTGGNHILIISDSKGGIQQGSGINFIMDGDKLKFEICKHNIEQKGLKVSTNLLNLGIIVN
jgi:hypothetical protein